MRKLLVVMAAAGVTLLSLRAQGQSNSPSGDQTTNDRISITISVKQAVFKVGEPIVVTAAVKDVSEYKYCEYRVSNYNHAEWNGYNITVKNAEGNEVPRIPKPHVDWRMRPELTASRGKRCIAPGETFKEALIANEIMSMSGPGTYSIQLVHRDHETDTQMASNVIQITVTQ
jgi:hypothetical protein